MYNSVYYSTKDTWVSPSSKVENTFRTFSDPLDLIFKKLEACAMNRPISCEPLAHPQLLGSTRETKPTGDDYVICGDCIPQQIFYHLQGSALFYWWTLN